MTRAKNFKKKSSKKYTNISKNNLNRLGRFFKNLAGKELAIGITIGFILMSFLMLFANNMKVGKIEYEGTSIHAAAGIELEAIPGIGQ
ncbi:MAG: hypothetical protein WAZ12_05205 [Candidatus Absconditicoccaceae bacterium]